MYCTSKTKIYCPDMPPSSLLVAVTSAVHHQAMRSQIRSTWGRECLCLLNCHYVFIMGRSHSQEENLKVRQESLEHKDVLQVDFMDSYNNLTLKTLHSIRSDLLCLKCSLGM